jgi:peptide/nickel transport system ATP-binding protein
MENRYNDFPLQFSGGMRQRVVIAIALACEPELLLADEPTTALDVTIQAQMLELRANLKAQKSTTMILITHDLGVVAENCDSLAVIYAGKIVESGSREDVFLHPSHPYTIGLFQSLPSFSIGKKRLQPIPGTLPDPTRLPPGCAFSLRCQYATDDCRGGETPLKEISPGHLCLCHRPIEVVDGWKA